MIHRKIQDFPISAGLEAYSAIKILHTITHFKFIHTYYRSVKLITYSIIWLNWHFGFDLFLAFKSDSEEQLLLDIYRRNFGIPVQPGNHRNGLRELHWSWHFWSAMCSHPRNYRCCPAAFGFCMFLYIFLIAIAMQSEFLEVQMEGIWLGDRTLCSLVQMQIQIRTDLVTGETRLLLQNWRERGHFWGC